VGPDHVAIDDFLAGRGLVDGMATRQARAVLEGAGLTRRGKSYLHRSKVERAAAAIDAALVRACAACTNTTGSDSGRPRVLVEQPGCTICRGSRIRSTAVGLRAGLEEHGIRRILVVGGSPEGQAHLRAELAGPGIELQLVDGTRTPGSERARRMREAADVVVIWGGTPLDHTVSERFIDPSDRSRTITIPRGGPQSVLRALAEHLRRRG
jgi:hypothetical protein